MGKATKKDHNGPFSRHQAYYDWKNVESVYYVHPVCQCQKFGEFPCCVTQSNKLFCFLSCSEKASLAVTLVNANNDVMGHAAFFDYPNLPSVDQSKWEDWLHSKYDCDKCNVSITTQVL